MFSPLKKECEMMDILMSLIMVIMSHCVHASNHKVASVKYTQFLIMNYTLINLREKSSK